MISMIAKDLPHQAVLIFRDHERSTVFQARMLRTMAALSGRSACFDHQACPDAGKVWIGS